MTTIHPITSFPTLLLNLAGLAPGLCELTRRAAEAPRSAAAPAATETA